MFSKLKTYERGVHSRETIAALNYEIHQMSKNTPFYATQIINPFINSKISTNHDKIDGLSANCEILIREIVSLL